MLGWILLLASAELAQPAPIVQATVDPSDCYEARATPFYEGLGWSHYVEVTNSCDPPLLCLVATSVDPQPRYEVIVPGHESATVRTRHGSPTYVYTPIVSCDFFDVR